MAHWILNSGVVGLLLRNGDLSVKFWTGIFGALSTVTRYILVATACIFLAECFLLLVFGQRTEETYRLAAHCLARAIISGGIAAWWFYRARKARALKEPPLLQKQSAPVPQTTTQEQLVLPIPEPVSAVSSGSVPTADRHERFFWKEKTTVLTVLGGVVAVAVLIVVTRAPSQPRFTHQGGAPELMFDNKTSQECWAGPVHRDDGIAAMDRTGERVQQANRALEEELDRHSNGECEIGAPEPRPQSCDLEDRAGREFIAAMDASKQAEDRVEYLREHPEAQRTTEEQKPILMHGLPYCKDLE
jgi:hypothetical protein